MPAPVAPQSINICIWKSKEKKLKDIRNKRAAHEYNSFYNPSAETSALHLKRPRSIGGLH